MTLERFWREIEGSIKDLQDDLKAEFALTKCTKDLNKSDLAMKKVLCKTYREGQVSGFNHVRREYRELNFDLKELEHSLKLTIKHKEIILNGAFNLDSTDTEYLKIIEQGMKASYEYVLYLLGEID